MTTFALIVMAGMAVGVSGCSNREEAPVAASAPADEQKKDPTSAPAHEQKLDPASAPTHQPKENPASAPADEQKVDMTPKLKAGDVFTFKQHIVRSETKVLGGMPKAQDPTPPTPKDDGAKPADGAKGDGKDDAKKDEPKKEEPKKADPTAQMLKQSWSIDQTATYELRVVSAGETGSMLELELKGITASADLPNGKFTWSHDQAPDDKDMQNPLIVTYKPIINGVVKIAMGPDGAITQVQPDPRVNLTVKGTLAPMVQLLFSPDMVKFRWGPIIWPKDGREPAKVGTAWKNSDEVPHAALGRFVYTTSNTVKSVKGDLAEIDITGELKLVPGEASKASQGTLTEQMVKGSAVFDTKAGMMKSHTWMERSHLDVNAQGLGVNFDKDLKCTTTRE